MRKFDVGNKVIFTEMGIKEVCELTHTQFFHCFSDVIGIIGGFSKMEDEDNFWYFVDFPEVNLKYWIEEPNIKLVEE